MHNAVTTERNAARGMRAFEFASVACRLVGRSVGRERKRHYERDRHYFRIKYSVLRITSPRPGFRSLQVEPRR